MEKQDISPDPELVDPDQELKDLLDSRTDLKEFAKYFRQ